MYIFVCIKGSTCKPILARRLAGHITDYKKYLKGTFHYLSSFKKAQITVESHTAIIETQKRGSATKSNSVEHMQRHLLKQLRTLDAQRWTTTFMRPATLYVNNYQTKTKPTLRVSVTESYQNISQRDEGISWKRKTKNTQTNNEIN